MTAAAPPPPLVAAVAVGGALGAMARWLLGEAVPDGAGFPATTLVVNVTGCLLLALLPAIAVVRRRPALTAGLGPGLLGGFTTLSAWSEQSRALLGSGHPGLAAAYLLGTVAACLAAVALGSRLAARLPAAEGVTP